MDGARFTTSVFGSIGIHLSALLALQLALVLASPPPRLFDPLIVAFVPGGAGDPEEASMNVDDVVEEPTIEPPPAPLVSAPKPPPLPSQPKPAERRPEVVEGVRVASPEQVLARKEIVPERIETREPDPESTAPAAEVAAKPVPAPKPQTRKATKRVFANQGEAGLARRGALVVVRHDEWRPPTFAADAPGYGGRIFGQISVAGSSADHYYGRIHLFPEHAVYRDYSDQSLFGYSFRQQLNGDAARDFQVGRVQTPGAYLIVTDLFGNGRHSTMAHTVVLVFPRTPPPGSDLLYDVRDDGGSFRLRGPGGTALSFDGRTGALRGASGFVVRPPGGTGTPPRVGFQGLHVVIHSVGGNPFARGRGATVIDDTGRSCRLTTTDLFNYQGTNESDVFRFPTDAAFFSFLRQRCAGLRVPQAADVQMARAEPSESPAASRGLIPALFRALRGR